MKQILRNIRQTMHHEKMIFIVMCVCVFTSSIILYFAYGLYCNYNQEKYEANKDLKEIEISINPNSTLLKKDFQKYVESLSDETLGNISLWFVSGDLSYFEGYPYHWLDCRFIYQEHKYTIPDSFRENKEKFLLSGRFISNDEEADGAFVTVVANNEGTGWNNATESLRISKNEIEMFGNTYKVIGESKQGAVTPIIPFLTVPDDFVFNDIVILEFNQVVNKNIYNELKKQAELIIPDSLQFPDLKLPDADSISMYNNIIWISLFISILSVINYAMLFHFIMETRSRDLAIMRICGCTKCKVFLMYLTECVFMTVPAFLIGSAFFSLLLDRTIDQLFPFMKNYYSFATYGIIFGGYLLVSIIILSIQIIRYLQQSILNGWKEGI